ncbi:MAG: F0F1 ATP synthase subunit A [Clostridia bacterium]|nr:F0F1 ATP synthase subunit A [Clostridia bacterium]
MNIDVSGAKVFLYSEKLGGAILTETIVNMWIVMAVVALICFVLTRNLKPHSVSKRQAAAEFIVQKMTNMVKENMGEKFAGMAPFITALMALSALCSLSSLLGMYAPTSDLSTVLGWALLVFAMITYQKFKTSGFLGYFKGYTEPIVVLTPFNIISEIATPISMAFRHFGNIASGSVITALVYAALAALSHGLFSILPGALGQTLSQIPILQVGIPAVLSIYFDLFSSCLQAFIFCMLTMMYIGSAAEG